MVSLWQNVKSTPDNKAEGVFWDAFSKVTFHAFWEELIDLFEKFWSKVFAFKIHRQMLVDLGLYDVLLI